MCGDIVKFRLVENFLQEASPEINRDYGDKVNSGSVTNPSGEKQNFTRECDYVKHKLNIEGDVEIHHIEGTHRGEMLIAPKGFNTKFHNFVLDNFEKQYKQFDNYKEWLSFTDDLVQCINLLKNISKPPSDKTRHKINNSIHKATEILENELNKLPPEISKIRSSTHNARENIFKTMLQKLFDGEIRNPQIAKYQDKIMLLSKAQEELKNEN